MINLSEEYIFNIVNQNLDLFITEDINTSYNNIKNFTITLNLYAQYLYDSINKLLPIDESSFSEFLGNYFTDPISSQIGRIINVGIIGTDLTVGTITSGSISSASTTFLTSALTKLGFASAGASTISSLVVGLGPLLLLVIIFAYYNYIKFSDVRNVKVFIDSINKLSVILKFNINKLDNVDYKNLFKEKCANFKDKRDKLECAIFNYVSFINKEILKDYIFAYTKYLKENNENISDIKSFNELVHYIPRSNPDLAKLNKRMYSSFVLLLKNIKKDKSFIGETFMILNNYTLIGIKK